jgi:heme-degrading monooxygenase HmoA
MFVTIVEGEVDPDREDDLRAEWERRRSELPVGLVESLLLRGEKSDTWRIVSLWESREAVMAMRASGERPGALAMFEEAGAEPTPSFWNVEDHASPDEPRAGNRGS